MLPRMPASGHVSALRRCLRWRPGRSPCSRQWMRRRDERRKPVRRPLRNMTALFAGDVASRGIGFLITIYLARILGPAGFGLVSVGMALLGHLQLLSSPGVQLVEARNTARADGMDDRRFSGVLALRLALSIVLFVIAVLILIVNPYGATVRSVML